jgi:phosphomannomutase
VDRRFCGAGSIPDLLAGSFFMTISFGTDGWRAVISDTFTFTNLRLVAQAIADAAASPDWNRLPSSPVGPSSREFVVGFDTRFLSDRYAVEVARVLAANGYNVHLSQADAPTPAISYMVHHLKAMGGVMITASHNAPRYNGVKLKSSYGGSALPEQCRRVEIYLSDNEARGHGPNLMDYGQALAAKKIRRFNPTPAYHEHLRKLINFDAISNNPPHVVVDSMYGSGRGQIKTILQGTGCEVFEVRGEMNPGFGGVHPEPIARNLGALAGAIAAGNGEMGVATDGDADRTGAMDGRGQFVDPHRIMALALRYLVEKRGWRGKVVKTVSTTQMINRLAAKYELEVLETPVGFNYIAEHMLKDNVLIGGEESGGMSFHGHIPEGDGVLFGLLLIEMVAVYQEPLDALVADLLREAGPALYERRDLRLVHPVLKTEITQRLAEHPPASLGGLKVVKVQTLDGVKYLLEDDSWLLIRPSGTEPVLRVYAEGRDEKMVKALLSFGEKVAQEAI